METLISEATRLSEFGEALPQSNIRGTEAERHLESQISLAQWYALHTYPRHEKRVHETLSLRSIESFLPSYETMHRWKNGCNMRVELPLFPGYLFVKINPRERFRAVNLPGVVSLVGSPAGPWPLPEVEVTNLRASLQSRQLQPYPYLAVGQKVRIKSGPLAGLTGFFARQSGVCRVVISVELIQQAAAVEVDADNVEPIGPAPTSIENPGTPARSLQLNPPDLNW